MYILDTDSIIYFFKAHPKITQKLTTVKTRVVTTAINQAELFFGAYHSTRKHENLLRLQNFFKDIPLLPFDHEATEIFGEHKALLKKKGNLIADCDLMIASIALAHQGTLVTNNTKHFQKIKNLKYVNWLLN